MAQKPKTFMDEVRTNDPLFFVMVGVAGGFLLAAIIFNSSLLGQDFIDSLGPEAVGIAFTVLVLERLSNYQNRQREKKRLVTQTRSGDKRRAQHAIEELRLEGWLKDGSLRSQKFRGVLLRKGIDLQDADLEATDWHKSSLKHADMTNANLQRAVFRNANLQKATLADACLLQANLVGADLQGAHLINADLREADLSFANLKGAILAGAKLQGARLTDTKLEGAEILQAEFDETTTLPNMAHWDPRTDLTRFTDPNHPDFWRSGDRDSISYKGDFKI